MGNMHNYALILQVERSVVMAQHDAEHQPTSIPSYLFEEHTDSTFFVSWYRFTAPAAPDVFASRKAWCHFRSARTTSRVLLVLLLLSITSLSAGFLNPNFVFVPLLITALPMLVLATTLNRLGQTTLSGAFIIALVEGGLLGTLLLFHEDVGQTSISAVDLLTLPLVLTALLLPIWWVFGVALLNGLSTVFILLVGLHASVMLISQPLLLQGLVSLATLLWMRETARTMARAERAEVIARLEHDLATHGHMIAEQKQQLEEELQQIIDTHMRVANGDLTARVPFDETHVLWQLAGVLNTLLARYQHAKQAEDEPQRTCGVHPFQGKRT